MSSLKSVIGGILIGGVIGYGVNKLKQPEYTLNEKNNTTFLESKSVDKAYEVNKTQDNFYLGDLEHNLLGVRELAYMQGLNESDTLIKGDSTSINREYIRDELERIVEEKYESLKHLFK